MSNVLANSFSRTPPRLSKMSSGALEFDVLEEAAEPCRFTLYEVYRNAADFDAHLQSSHFESFSKATRDLFVSQSVRQLDLKNEKAALYGAASRSIRG